MARLVLLARLHALVVPLLIAVTSLAYWVQIAGARRSVVLVPSGILILIAVLLAIVIVEDYRSPQKAPVFGMDDVGPPLLLLALFVFYYFAINILGFHVANLLFSIAASLLMRLNITKSLVVAAISTAVMFGLAEAMNFNVPDPFWAR